MNKGIVFVFFIAISAVFFSLGCSKDLDYRKACEEHDFTKAYKIADEVNTSEAKRYVILQEAIYVLESHGSEGLIRIVGIAKEHNADRWLYGELMDVANKIGEAELAGKLEDLDPNNTFLSPSDLSISGPLNEYFEVEDTKIKYTSGDEITIRIKRVKEGMPRQCNTRSFSGIHFIADFLGKDGTPLLKRTTRWFKNDLYIGSDDYKELLQSNVGEYKTITFKKDVRYIDEDPQTWMNLPNCQQFKISSMIENH